MKKIELVCKNDVVNLEGPVWDKERQAVWCVGIEEGLVFCIDVKTGNKRIYDVKSQVGCIALKNDTFLAATYNGIFEVNIESGTMTYIDQVNKNKSLRFNDGKMDRRGRFLLGTTGYKRYAEGENYLFSWNGSETKVLVKDTTISNGIGFSKDDKYLYFVDTPTKAIGKYRYDIETGNAVFEENVVYVEGNGLPDGLCMDIDDNIWLAEWGGAQLTKWNSKTGAKIDCISMPVLNVSSCCLGGDDFEYLYITTAKHDDGSESEADAGGLFRCKIR